MSRGNISTIFFHLLQTLAVEQASDLLKHRPYNLVKILQHIQDNCQIFVRDLALLLCSPLHTVHKAFHILQHTSDKTALLMYPVFGKHYVHQHIVTPLVGQSQSRPALRQSP